MTTEEAIKQLKEYILGMNYMDDEAVLMAIKALEIQACKPNGDDWESYADRLYDLAYQHGQGDKEPCDDCISRQRQAVLDIINFEDKWLLDAKSHNDDTRIAFSAIKSKISEMSYVTPKAKMGRWINLEETKYKGQVLPFWGRYECSKCGGHGEGTFDYCPNCGARMAESEENA